LVGVDAEVVEQLPTAGAADAALTDGAKVYRGDLGGRPAGAGVLGEVDVPRLAVGGAVVDEIGARAGGEDPREDGLDGIGLSIQVRPPSEDTPRKASSNADPLALLGAAKDW
jgi:hypothetical protein